MTEATITDTITGVSIPVSVFNKLQAEIRAIPEVISSGLEPKRNHSIFEEFVIIVYAKEYKFNATHRLLKRIEHLTNTQLGTAIYLLINPVSPPPEEYLRLSAMEDW